MFIPTNLDEVCVQATHMESKGKNTKENFSKKPFKTYGNKFKGKGKGKHAATVKKEREKTTCTHCQKKGHDASKCWKLHLEFKPTKFHEKEDKKTTAPKIQHDLGSDSGGETKIVATSIPVKILQFQFQSMNLLLMKEREVIYFILG